MKTHAFTWLGLTIVVLGWVLLVADIILGDTVLKSGTLVATLSLRGDVMTVAQTAILSGFGLAITGTLISGFGAFSKFFDAVLHRSASPRSVPVSPREEPTVSTPPAGPSVVMPMDRSAPIIPSTPPPTPPPPLRAKERNYVILADGSVEVETMFGTRVFATLDEAREFIR